MFFYYYVDYELFDGIDEELGYFHAQWNRQCPTDGVAQGSQSNFDFQVTGKTSPATATT